MSHLRPELAELANLARELAKKSNSASPGLKLQVGHHTHLVICLGSGAMNLSSQACMTSILAVESYSLPLQHCFVFEESRVTAVMGMKG